MQLASSTWTEVTLYQIKMTDFFKKLGVLCPLFDFVLLRWAEITGYIVVIPKMFCRIHFGDLQTILKPENF